MLGNARRFRLLSESLDFVFFLLLPHFVACGCLMFIFMQFYSRSWVQLCWLLLSALIRMLLVIFVRQRGFQVIAALAVLHLWSNSLQVVHFYVWLNTLHKCLHRGAAFNAKRKRLYSFWIFLNYSKSLEMLLTNMHMSHARSHLCSCYPENSNCCSLKTR